MSGFLSAATNAIPLLVLISIRVAATLAALPSPFGEGAPMVVRAGLSMFLAGAIGLQQVVVAPPISLSVLSFGVAALGEILCGATIGVLARACLAAAGAAGAFAGQSMGLGFASSFDPLSGEETTATERLFHSFAALIFLGLRGHHHVIAALAESVRRFPPGHAFSMLATDKLASAGSIVLAQGLRIASPVIATMFVLHIGTALITRAAPKVQLFSLVFALAAGAGLLTLWVAAPSVLSAIASSVRALPASLSALATNDE